MRRLLSVLAIISCCDAADWIAIQPRASFEHWTRVPMTPTTTLDAVSQWSILPDGTLLCHGTAARGHEFLRYDRELGDFALHVEWRFRKLPDVPGGKPQHYNSGVYVRTAADGSRWFQAQIGAPGNSGFFFYDEFRDGVKRRVNLKSQMLSDPVRPPGEWNTFDIRAQGRSITLTVNGVETSHFECERLRGYNGLEAEHYPIEFRNVKWKELP